MEESKNICPGCGRGCPLDAPGCPRGEEYARTGVMPERGAHGEHGGHGHGKHGGHRHGKHRSPKETHHGE